MTVKNVLLFNTDAISEALTPNFRRDSRVVGDAVLVLNFINKKILKSNRDFTHYMTLNNTAMTAALGLTAPQVHNAKKMLSKYEFIFALPPRQVNGGWVNVWSITPPQGSLSMMVSVDTMKPWEAPKAAITIRYEEDSEKTTGDFILWMNAVSDVTPPAAFEELLEYELQVSRYGIADMLEDTQNEIVDFLAQKAVIDLKVKFDEINSAHETYNVSTVEELDAILDLVRATL